MRLQDKEIKRFHTKDLHYLSIWWLNNQGFGAARLAREVTDAWIQKKWSLGGVSFTSEAPELSDKEIESIPGGKASLGHWDTISWEVLERTNAGMTIKVDEDKYWRGQGGQISQQYDNLKSKHQELISLSQQSGSTGEQGSKEGAVAEEESGTGENPPATLDSLAKLEELHGIVVKSPSEVSNIELVLCKDDTIWAVCSQDKVIGKHIVLAGFGTGIWVPEGESEPGVDFKLDSDKTLVQLDESSFSSEAQGVTTLSLFKLLVRAEKEKGLTEHRLRSASRTATCRVAVTALRSRSRPP